MKNKKLLLLLPIMLLTLGCSKKKDNVSEYSESSLTSTSYEITDLTGRKVTLSTSPYKRVVCIGAGALRLYSYICDTSLLCGVEDIDNLTLTSRPKMFDSVARPYVLAYKDVYSALPSCGVGGPNAQEAEPEKLLSCNPDIVISLYNDVSKNDALEEELGVPVISLRYGSKGIFDENVTQSLSLLGTVFGATEKADTLISYINTEKSKIEERVKNVSEKPITYICGLGNWGTTNYLMTSQNYEPFNIANIQNALVDLAVDGIQSIEKEKFEAIGSSIDKMIIDAAAVKNIKPSYQEDNTIFSSCKAWNNNEVYLEMAYNAYYTNLEIALCNTWFNAKAVYPSLFEDINIDDKLNEITLKFLGKELKDDIYALSNSFGGYQKINTETFFN